MRQVFIVFFLLLCVSNLVAMDPTDPSPSPAHQCQSPSELLRAASHNELDRVQRLLLVPPPPEIADSALQRAAEKGLSIITDAIIDSKQTTYYTERTLKRAILKKRLETIYALRARKTTLPHSIWKLAFEQQSPEVVAALLTDELKPTDVHDCYTSLIESISKFRLDPTLVRMTLAAIKRPLSARAFAGDIGFLDEKKSCKDALLWATLGQQRHAIQQILGKKTSIDAQSMLDETVVQALFTAAVMGNRDITQDLVTHIKRYAQISPRYSIQVNKLLNSALFKATAANQGPNIRLFLANNACFEHFNEKSMEDLAATINSITLSTLREEYGYDLFSHPNPIRLLRSAAKHGNLDMIDECIERSIDINTCDTSTPEKPSILSIAAQYGQADAVKELVKNGATDILTSVNWAIEYGRTEVVRAFLELAELKKTELDESKKLDWETARKNAELYFIDLKKRSEAGYESEPETPYTHAFLVDSITPICQPIPKN